MPNLLDLEKHFSILNARKINKIISPLFAFNIKHFRYLKLYHDGSRTILSNQPECIRYFYEKDRYKKMWFDGEFPEYLKEGIYYWNLNRLQDCSEAEEQLESEINTILGLYHGITFVKPSINFYEIYSFDSACHDVYHTHKKVFLRFIMYFKEHAKRLIDFADAEKMILPIKNTIIQVPDDIKKTEIFFDQTKINKYYLNGKYHNAYLTNAELQCIYWLAQGKSAEEIGIIVGSKPKTIQCHLDNVKKKLHCYKQTELIKIIVETGILDIFL